MNVNTAQVAQEKLARLIEAAVNVRMGYAACSCGRCAHCELDAAIAEARKPAALTAPEPEGDVVERAALIARDAYQRGMWQGAFKDTMTMDGWRAVAHALAAAGLLARPLDREGLERVVLGIIESESIEDALPTGNPLHPVYEWNEDWLNTVSRRVADAILREIGGGR